LRPQLRIVLIELAHTLALELVRRGGLALELVRLGDGPLEPR